MYQLEVAKILKRIDTQEKHPPSLVKSFQNSGLSQSYSTYTGSLSQLHIPQFKTTVLQKSFTWA